MEKSVRNLYNEAKENIEFKKSLINAGEEHHEPSLLWDKKLKIIYASIYMGWLIGKGIYNESNYS